MSVCVLVYAYECMCMYNMFSSVQFIDPKIKTRQ